MYVLFEWLRTALCPRGGSRAKWKHSSNYVRAKGGNVCSFANFHEMLLLKADQKRKAVVTSESSFGLNVT